VSKIQTRKRGLELKIDKVYTYINVKYLYIKLNRDTNARARAKIDRGGGYMSYEEEDICAP
jgi:hypothetical protein